MPQGFQHVVRLSPLPVSRFEESGPWSMLLCFGLSSKVCLADTEYLEDAGLTPRRE
jgi:hypothetical protein